MDLLYNGLIVVIMIPMTMAIAHLRSCVIAAMFCSIVLQPAYAPTNFLRVAVIQRS